MPGQKPIVVVGSINTDLVASAKVIPAIGETVMGTDFQIHPGGKDVYKRQGRGMSSTDQAPGMCRLVVAG